MEVPKAIVLGSRLNQPPCKNAQIHSIKKIFMDWYKMFFLSTDTFTFHNSYTVDEHIWILPRFKV